MAITVERRLNPTQKRRFGTGRQSNITSDLTKIQTASYEAFLQYNKTRDQRKEHGLEAVLREIFPIESYDKTTNLEYVHYELGKPRYSPDECRQLRLTYGRPFKVRLRLNKDEPIEEDVYLGDLPIMLGGGEFIINGAERVVVSQLHRSPGVDFVMGVGGAFDVLSGRRRRAPKALQGLGLEWAWRWAQEPRRLAPRYGWDGARFALVTLRGGPEIQPLPQDQITASSIRRAS